VGAALIKDVGVTMKLLNVLVGMLLSPQERDPLPDVPTASAEVVSVGNELAQLLSRAPLSLAVYLETLECVAEVDKRER